MTSQRTELVEVGQRLERVERQNRRLRRAGIALFVVVAAGLLMAQAPPKERIVEAEGFRLKDRQGNVRAELVVSRDGPRLVLFGEGGKEHKERLTLDVVKEGPILTLYDANGQGRLSLTALLGEAGLDLQDHGNTRVHLYSRGGDTWLLASDATGQGRAKLEVLKDRTSLALFDEKGKTIWSAP